MKYLNLCFFLILLYLIHFNFPLFCYFKNYLIFLLRNLLFWPFQFIWILTNFHLITDQWTIYFIYQYCLEMKKWNVFFSLLCYYYCFIFLLTQFFQNIIIYLFQLYCVRFINVFLDFYNLHILLDKICI